MYGMAGNEGRLGGSYLPLSLKVWHALSFKSSRRLDDHLTYKRWPSHGIKKQVGS